ncbi:hypothetical protein BYT27DRAFT_6390127 [Phlegmacium glaucopus]|nr:hypothetical protein BYT27DRAFT_6390127 [Phlegmacium glaucopus]
MVRDGVKFLLHFFTPIQPFLECFESHPHLTKGRQLSTFCDERHAMPLNDTYQWLSQPSGRKTSRRQASRANILFLSPRKELG